MGGVAEAWAQHVVLTSDNPRGEDALSIAKDVLSGVKDVQKVKVELDRRGAIALAIEGAQSQDVVLLAGKGHEQTQEVDGVKSPFNDAQVARQTLEKVQHQKMQGGRRA
jgi:UDP-N-acetylmuramoyl-L-alanyl-D-glutamate--2,6-diaminopimelate ligase